MSAEYTHLSEEVFAWPATEAERREDKKAHRNAKRNAAIKRRRQDKAQAIQFRKARDLAKRWREEDEAVCLEDIFDVLLNKEGS